MHEASTFADAPLPEDTLLNLKAQCNLIKAVSTTPPSNALRADEWVLMVHPEAHEQHALAQTHLRQSSSNTEGQAG